MKKTKIILAALFFRLPVISIASNLSHLEGELQSMKSDDNSSSYTDDQGEGIGYQGSTQHKKQNVADSIYGGDKSKVLEEHQSFGDSEIGSSKSSKETGESIFQENE